MNFFPCSLRLSVGGGGWPCKLIISACTKYSETADQIKDTLGPAIGCFIERLSFFGDQKRMDIIYTAILEIFIYKIFQFLNFQFHRRHLLVMYLVM